MNYGIKSERSFTRLLRFRAEILDLVQLELLRILEIQEHVFNLLSLLHLVGRVLEGLHRLPGARASKGLVVKA